MDYKNRIISDNIQSLRQNEVFVFGSNLSGFHGAGAAKLAFEKFGAEYGLGYGYSGQTYAIPTKSHRFQRTLKTFEIGGYVTEFIGFATCNSELTFLVTEIGCGLAGYKPSDIAPLFSEAKDIPNIHLPQRFWNEILKNHG